MTHGFDINSPLVCEGVVGDGCGGGRLFIVENKTLFAYDPETEESIALLESVINAKKISKSACIITIECESKNRKFDLSKMKEI